VGWDAVPESKLFGTSTPVRLADVLEHPALFKAYPDLADMKLVKRSGFLDFGGLQGWFDGKGTFGITPYAQDPRSTLLHEVQHWIQRREGYAVGGNENMVFDAMTPEQIARAAAVVEPALQEKIDQAAAGARRYRKAIELRKVPAVQALVRADEAFMQAYKAGGGMTDASRAAFDAKTEAEKAVYEALAGPGKGFFDVDQDTRMAILTASGSQSDEQLEKFAQMDDARGVKLQQLLAGVHSGAAEAVKEALKESDQGHTFYQRIAGEIEARDVQARKDLSDEQRANMAPFSSEQHDPADVITFTEPPAGGAAESREFRPADPDELNSLVPDAGYPLRPVRQDVPTVQAARRLNTLLADLDAGRITQGQFDLQLRMLADKMAEASEAKQANRVNAERQRGADMLMERLLRARRAGDLDAETVEFGLWMLRKYPHLAEDLGISVRNNKDPMAAGRYEPLSRIVILMKQTADVPTVVHEILHHAERMMPPSVQAAIVRRWLKAYQAALRSAFGSYNLPMVRALFDIPAAIDGDKKARERLRNAFRDGVLEVSKHYQLVNASEYWAENASRLLREKYESGSWLGVAKRFLKALVEGGKHALGMASDWPVLNGLATVIAGDGGFWSPHMLLQGAEAPGGGVPAARFESLRSAPVQDANAQAAKLIARYREAFGTPPSGMTMPQFKVHMKEATAAREKLSKQILELAEKHDILALPLRSNPRTLIVLHRDTKKEGAWRTTFMIAATMEPSGHMEYHKPVDAAYEFWSVAGEQPHDKPLFALAAQQEDLFEPDLWAMPEDTPTRRRLDALIYEMQDGRIDLKRVQQAIAASGQQIEQPYDARLSESLYPGRVARRNEVFIHREVKPLLKAMATARVSMTELGDFLLARHAPERNEVIAQRNPNDPTLQDGGAGTNSQGVLMTTEAARDYMAAIPQARREQLDELAAAVDRITKGTRQLLVREGLESQETIDAWEQLWPNYAPLFKDEGEHPHPQGMGFTVRGPSSKHATGSHKTVTNVLAHVLMQREAAITRAEKNRVLLALYGMALSHPNPDFWTTVRPRMTNEEIGLQMVAMGIDPDTAAFGMVRVPTIRDLDPVTRTVVKRPNPLYKSLPGALTLRVNGEDRVILLNQRDPRALRMAEDLKNLDGLTRVDWSVGVLHRYLSASIPAGLSVAGATRWIAAVNTQYNPAFGLVNLTRDTWGGLVNLNSTPLRGRGLKVLKDVPLAMVGISWGLFREHHDSQAGLFWSKLWQEYQAVGGRTGWRQAFALADDRARAIEAELKAAGPATLGLVTRRAGRWLLNLLDGFNVVLENAVRLAAYKEALDKGMSRPEASRLVRELTLDFNR
jgi:hypothetical protein